MANNVFQMLAQQEIDRPERELKKMQLQQLLDDAKYKQDMKTALASMPQTTQVPIGSANPTMQPQDNPLGQNYSPAPVDLSALGIPQQPIMQQKPVTLKQQLDRQLQYHIDNNRPDLAEEVYKHQMDILSKADNHLNEIYNRGGQPAVDQYLKDNPHIADFTGPVKRVDDNILHPYQNADGTPSTTNFYRIENGKHVDVSATPKTIAHIPEGSAVPDGKGGWIVPAPKTANDKLQVVEIPSSDGKTAQKFSVNLGDGTKTPIGKPYAVKSQVMAINNGTTGDNAQIAAWADKIAKGETTLSEIPGRGPIRSQVIQYLTKNYPEVNLAEAGARKKWTQSPTSMQTLALVDATKGVIEDMRTAYKKLDKTDIPVLNAAQDVWQKWSGNPNRAEYMSMKNYGIQEVEKMLSGSGAMSDHRIKLAFDNLKETNTPEQFERAIKGIQNVMAERERATRQGPYKQSQTGGKVQKIGKYTVEVH